MKNDTCEIRPNYVVNVFWEDDDRWYQSSMSIGRFATAYLLSDESRSLINYWQGNVTSPLQWCVVVSEQVDLGGWLKIPPAGIAKGSHLDVKKCTSFPTEFSIFFRQMYSALKPGSADTQLLFSLILFLTHFPPKKTKSERSFQKVKFGLNWGKFDATLQL